MFSFQKIDRWASQHHPKWLDLLRILLGLIFIIKGIAFIANKDIIMNTIAQNEYWVVHYAVAHYVIGGYIVCGTAIILGLFFRIAVLFEIPALIGSIFYIDMHKNLFALNSQLAYSIIILALLLFFFLYGPGKFSLDYYLQTHKDKNYDAS